jgi:hypothetical protein
MGKFDKYDSTPALPGGARAVTTTSNSSAALAKIEARAQSTAAAGGPESARRSPTVAIALDATGSMYALIQSAKDAIGEIMRLAADRLGRPLEIELLVYRDYDQAQRVLESSGKSKDNTHLARWLAKIEALGGGGNGGEAVEVALDQVLSDGKFACVLLAGDEPSNSASSIAKAGRQGKITAKQIATKLRERGIPIHAFVVGDCQRTIQDFQKLAELSGGKSGRLDGTREMIDLAVMAILASINGPAAAASYASSINLTPNTEAFVLALTDGRTK